MIPSKKKTPEELAALREEHGILENPNPSSPPVEAAPHPESSQTQSTEPRKPKKRKIHPLRKNEFPLAPAPKVEHKTELPSQKHNASTIAEVRRQETLSSMTSSPQDPAAHLKKMTAHPALLTLAYLFAATAGVAAWQRVFFATPASLISISIIFALFIYFKKKRSRHHAAILTIIIIMTLVFGGLYYVPFFTHAT